MIGEGQAHLHCATMTNLGEENREETKEGGSVSRLFQSSFRYATDVSEAVRGKPFSHGLHFSDLFAMRGDHRTEFQPVKYEHE